MLNNIFNKKTIGIENAQRFLGKGHHLIVDDENPSVKLMSAIILMTIHKIQLPAILVFEDYNGQRSFKQNNRIITAITHYMNDLFSLDTSLLCPELSGKKFSEINIKEQNTIIDTELELAVVMSHKMSDDHASDINNFFNLTYNLGDNT